VDFVVTAEWVDGDTAIALHLYRLPGELDEFW
jgi:hypothetical protein